MDTKFELKGDYCRRFSDPLRRHIVEKIKKGDFTVKEASRLWSVSTNSIYRWLHRYGVAKNSRQVVEMKSEGKKLSEMESRIRELEQSLGRKQMELDYLNKLVDITEDELKVNIRKKGSTPPSTGSVNTDTPMPTV